MAKVSQGENRSSVYKGSEKIRSRRAVTPVVATIFLVAIAVVSGGMVFAFSEEYRGHLEISNSVEMATLEITGYDARDISVLSLHNGVTTTNTINPGNFDGQTGNGLQEGERIAVYVKNNSVSEIWLSEISLAGIQYSFVIGDSLEEYSGGMMNPKEFVVVNGDIAGVANLVSSGTPKINSGEEVTLILELGNSFPTFRDAQFKITTANGASFVGTVYLGSHLEGNQDV